MLGSHNTLSYSRPCRWWGWLAKPFYKCQDATLAQQIERGCRAFDIRFLYDGKAGRWRSAHGAVALDADPLEAIRTICSRVDRPYIRVLLERGDAADMERFRMVCATLESDYPDAVFFCGRLKPGWKLLFDFGEVSAASREADATLIQHVGSMSGGWLGKVLPRVWARRHRADIPGAADYLFDLPIVLVDLISN